MTSIRSFGQRAILAALLGLGWARGAEIARTATPEGILLQKAPLLFADDSGLEKRQTVVRTVHPGRRRDAPVLVADRPWESMRAYMWGAVHYDAKERRFQMWYLSRAPNQKTQLLYATSTDGLNWEKPLLGLHSVQGSTANNVFDPAGGGSFTVIADAVDPDPARRYKLLVSRSGYRAAYSGDGIHWTLYPRNPVLDAGDTIMATQNPSTGEYLAFHKRPATVRGFSRRVVWLSRSQDFQTWSEPELVFVPDEADDDWSRRPQDRTEVYDMAVFPHAAGYIGFPAIFRNTPQTIDQKLKISGASAATGAIDIQLAASSDGRTWSRTWPRLALISRGAPGTYDGGAILNTASAPVDAGDETWVYYTAINTGHGAPVPPKAISIGRAEWRRHGFVSLDAGPEGGTIETKPLAFASPELVVNADASRGRLRVALYEADGRPIPGYGLAESDLLTSDAVRWKAGWRGRRAIPTDRPVRVQIEMTSTCLFSLESGGGSGS